MGSYFRDYYSPTVHQRPVVGDTKLSVASRDHLGWLNCDGRLVNVKDFYQLWEVVGYSFGGSGTVGASGGSATGSSALALRRRWGASSTSGTVDTSAIPFLTFGNEKITSAAVQWRIPRSSGRPVG